MKSVQGGATTYYVNDLVEYSNGVLTTFYVSGDGQRVAQRVGSAAPTYLLVDHLGSTRYVLDNSAQTLSAQRYFPWGSTHFATDANALPRRQYTGQMNDGDTDLYYYNARYYEPGLARFIQADTIVPEPGDPQMLNRYTYVRNNPLKYNDPSGHKPICDEDAMCEETVTEGCVAPCQSAPPSSVRYTYSWLTGYDSNGNAVWQSGASGGTYVGNGWIYTHGHQGYQNEGFRHHGTAVVTLTDFPGDPAVVDPGFQRRWSEYNSGELYSESIFFKALAGVQMPDSADFATFADIASLTKGDTVYAVYWSDVDEQEKMVALSVESVGTYEMIAQDSARVINKGDSGGGVFYNGKLIGNITWIYPNQYGQPSGGVGIALFAPTPQSLR